MEMILKLRDQELGDELVKITCLDDEDFYGKVKTADKLAEEYLLLAEEYLAIDEDDEDSEQDKKQNLFDTLKARIPNLTNELFEAAFEIFDRGYYGLTAERFCDLLKMGYNWDYDMIQEDMDVIII